MNKDTFLLVTYIIQTVLIIACLITVLFEKWVGRRRRRSKNALYDRLEENEKRNMERMEEIAQGIKTISKQLQTHAKKAPQS